MELGPKNHNGDGLLGPNYKMVVYMDPLGFGSRAWDFGVVFSICGEPGFPSRVLAFHI